MDTWLCSLTPGQLLSQLLGLFNMSQHLAKGLDWQQMSKQGTVCKSQVSATFSALSDARLVQLCIQHFLQKNLFECFPSSADKPGAG